MRADINFSVGDGGRDHLDAAAGIVAREELAAAVERREVRRVVGVEHFRRAAARAVDDPDDAVVRAVGGDDRPAVVSAERRARRGERRRIDVRVGDRKTFHRGVRGLVEQTVVPIRGRTPDLRGRADDGLHDLIVVRRVEAAHVVAVEQINRPALAARREQAGMRAVADGVRQQHRADRAEVSVCGGECGLVEGCEIIRDGQAVRRRQLHHRVGIIAAVRVLAEAAVAGDEI